MSQLREKYEQSLWLLLAIAGLVLLMACANLADLLPAPISAAWTTPSRGATRVDPILALRYE